jgi:hypothetical protein
MRKKKERREDGKRRERKNWGNKRKVGNRGLRKTMLV